MAQIDMHESLKRRKANYREIRRKIFGDTSKPSPRQTHGASKKQKSYLKRAVDGIVQAWRAICPGVETTASSSNPRIHQNNSHLTTETSSTPATRPSMVAHSNSSTVVAQVHAAPKIDYEEYYSHSYMDQGELKHVLRS